MQLKISELACDLEKDDEIIKKLTGKIKELEHKGYHFESANASFELLVLKELGKFQPFFEIIDYKVITSLSGKANAMIKIRVGERYEITADEGEGPVNAIDKALRKALGVFYPGLANMQLTDYKVRIINGLKSDDLSSNTAAVTRVLIESRQVKGSESAWITVGASDNIINASMIALVDSVEYMLWRNSSGNQKESY